VEGNFKLVILAGVLAGCVESGYPIMIVIKEGIPDWERRSERKIGDLRKS
jgi:hypothetical protein